MAFQTLLAGMKFYITEKQNSHEGWDINDIPSKPNG